MTTARVLGFALLLAACEREAIPPQVATGTWGGDNAAVVVSEAEAHVHLGCTKGDVAGPILLDAEGRFDVGGQHNVDAYPVDRGIVHPARYSGRANDREMTLVVRLTDTGQVLGPVRLFFGVEPRLEPCPICRR